MKKTKFKTILMLLLISLVLGTIATHYFEKTQTDFLVTLRNRLLANTTSTLIDDDQIIPKVKYSFSDQLQINPVTVAQSVKVHADHILDFNETGKNELIEQYNKEDLSRVIAVADFLINYAEKKQLGDLTYWLYPYKFDYPSYDEVLKAPWYSGMAQGQILETLLAAYIISDNDTYLTAAQKTANSFYVPVKDGGVSIFLPGENQGIWFEEYAHKDTVNPMPLNGHNFALLGLQRLVYFDHSYNFLYMQGIKALEYYLPKYDSGVWSKYDLIKYMANPKYHQIHIEQLKVLGEKNKNDLLLEYANKFTMQKYIPLGTVYRLIFYPHNSLIAVFSINTLSCFAICFFIYFKKKRVEDEKAE